MPRSPDSTTDTYLDVLRTLGVPDAALERHHGAGPETPLRVAIDGDRGSPTADLLSALEATGRLLDLRDGLAPDDGDRLTASLARFGLRVECEAVDDGSPDSDDSDGSSAGENGDADDASPDADLELRVTDDVTDETVRITTPRDAEAAVATLREELPGAEAITFAELLDGRHLVADPRELHLLARRYGARLQPYDDPLLVPEDALDLDEHVVDLDDRDAASAAPSTSAESTPASGASAPDGATSSPSTSAIASAPSDATSSAQRSATASSQRSTTASSQRSTAASAPDAASAAADADDSFGDFVSAVDDSATEAVESALESSGSKTHTIEGDGEDVAAASNATVGGGPKRTVSTSGIDDVFDHLESSATDDEQPAATTQTMSESTDPPTDATESSDDTDVTPNGLTGGPTRTVSTKSADDILQQATGERDFEEIAAEEGDADPEAVLADAEDVPPALEDSDVAAPLEPGDETAAATATASVDDADEPGSDTDEPAVGADEPAGAADVPPADPAATPAQDAADPIAVEPEGEEATPTDAGADTDAEPPNGDGEDDGAGEAAETDPATPMPAAAAGGDSERAAVADAASDASSEAASSDGSDAESTLPDDELLEEDVELRRGSEPVDQPATPGDESLDADPIESADVDSSETADADGPLAAAGGVEPHRSPGDSADTDDSADTEDAASTETPQSAAGTGAPSGEPDASTTDGAEIEESAGTEDDPGLVGRITSTIFGR